MKKIILLFLLSNICYAQIDNNIKTKFTETITGALNTVKSGQQVTLSINSINHFEYDKFSVDVNPFYNVSYLNGNATANEFLTKQDIGYKYKSYSAFIINQYDSSLIRGITSDEWNGIGIGKKFTITPKLTTSLSYCLEQQNRKYVNVDEENIVRHSIRCKIIGNFTNVNIMIEYYYQPSLNGSDVNVFGASTITFFPNKPINFVIQNVYNYMSTDVVKTIQNTTFGVKMNL